MNVIVVPETEKFIGPVSHEGLVWINLDLGVPNLKGQNAKYLAPYWISGKMKGANRIYQIVSVDDDGESTIIKLGNSFLLNEPWNNIGQHRRFEYHPLSSFGMKELKDGLLETI